MKRILSIIVIVLLLCGQALAFPPTPPATSPSAASTSAAGIVELATDAETVTGSATDRVTTPANITARLAAPGAIGGTTPGTGSFSSVTVTGLTASKPVFTDGSKGLSSSGTMPVAQGGTGLTALGTAGQVLRVNSGADALEYGTVSSTVPLGHLSGLTVSRKDNDEVYVSGGSIEVGGTLYINNAQRTVSVTEKLGYGDNCALHGSTGTATAEEGNAIAGKAFGVSGQWIEDYPYIDDNTCWIQFAFNSAKRIEKVTIAGPNELSGNMWATTWKLLASNTGAFAGEEGTVLDVVSDGTWGSSGSTKTWEFSNDTSYTYYRFQLLARYATGSTPRYLLLDAGITMHEGDYALSAATPYYIYVDPPSSGVELAVENLILSATAPSFDSAKGGYYHPTNTDQRAIAHFTTDASGYVPTSPFVHYQPVPQVSSGAQLLSITNLPLNADGETTIYTVPAGVRCILSYAILVAGADAGSTDLTIGADGAETDWLGTQQLDNLDAEYDAVMLMPVPNATPVKIKSYAAATVIKAVVANQAGGATNTLYLYGMLY